jgi:tetratricopeptide (TPR) repeat protein
VWTDYSTRDTADLVGLTESVVRSCVREGLLSNRSDSIPLRFSFQDLTVLKALKSLTQSGVSIRRARRQLRVLRKRCVGDQSLASLCIDAHNGHVVVRDQDQVWRADTGQLVFGFQFQEQQGDVTELPHRAALPGPEFIASQTADEWFEQALELEESSPDQAKQAYEQVLRQRPQCTETLVNLGRLHAESDKLEEANYCFKQALDIDPRESTALYNLGVISQDTGDDLEAIQYYEAALSIDRELAEAHYNLATIFDKTGDARSAIRHINEFRKLNKR